MLEISQYALNGAIAFTILGLLAEVLFITGKWNKQSENPWYTMAFTLVALALTLFYLGVRMVNTGHGLLPTNMSFLWPLARESLALWRSLSGDINSTFCLWLFCRWLQSC
nr:hypothetical protein [Corynebacterium pseudotuberculosis]